VASIDMPMGDGGDDDCIDGAGGEGQGVDGVDLGGEVG